METFEAVRTLLAVREYQDRSVSDEVISRVLEAGRLTGSSRNRQPWHFVVVREREALRQIAQHAVTGAYIAQAAFAIAVLVPPSGQGPMDAGRAGQDMALVAWEMGLGSNFVTNVDTPEIRQILGVPDGLAVQVILPFGYPARKLGRGRKQRKPLREIAHRERFGLPWTAD
jgi:nitroreductase